MNHINRMARNVASVLANLGEGRGLLGMERARRAEIETMLAQVTGSSRGAGRHAHRFIRNGVPLTSAPDESTLSEIAEAVSRWLANGDAPPGPVTETPSGMIEITERCGMRLDPALMLAEALRHVAFETVDGAKIIITRTCSGISAEYARGGVRWKDGIVRLRHRQMPQAWSSALVGGPLGRVVADRVISDRVVRKVCDVDDREGVLRIVTADEGRWVMRGEKRRG